MPNRLANETSPYLRQHKDNPVEWFSWGPEAFDLARQRNVPVLLSVGYSACHWCHVMAHECFEDDQTANLMNDLFVNIKVDREERPDIDALYMDAVQAMSGRGGWPMTVFMTPDGRPFFGGTYFPKPSFIQLMNAINDAWHNRRDDIENNISALVASLNRTAQITPDESLPTIERIFRTKKQRRVMKTLVVIPARFKSTRLPGKPLAIIGNKPMIQHTWERVRKSKADHIIIATDSKLRPTVVA